MSKKEKVIVIGAGLCGTLLSIRLAQRGYLVHLHERRDDMRKEHVDAGRSINLALSARGLRALEMVGLKDEIQKECIPMTGRMIHTQSGQKRLSPYSGRSTDFINSVSRGGLNIRLLDLAEAQKNITLTFGEKCTHVDLATATAYFEDQQGNSIQDQGDIVIGTDGAGSAVRKSMMGKSTQLLFNFSQDFLRHGYKELSIHPGENGAFQIEKNALHIWPRDQFMIIALPNLDGSFTVTMFHPFETEVGFNNLDTEDKVRSFFETYYPELIKLMPHYVEEYFENPVGTLGTIKCFPWQAHGKTLIMGDASHAIVPFYGQGMNAAFEDVFVFNEILDKHAGNWDTVFKAFENARVDNANAIADLAIDNFYEMQDKVNDPEFIEKRALEMQLEQSFPDYYSKYSLVTFRPELHYKEAMRLGRQQDKWLLDLCASGKAKELSLEEIRAQLKELV